jgi:TetR/AcrR family transcriptional repressor of nem operon
VKYEKVGKICGCPFSSIGSELSTQDEQIRRKAHDLADRGIKYLSATLRDAIAEGSIDAKDPVELAREVFCYVKGLIMQAKIENNAEILKCLKNGVFRLITSKSMVTAS